MKRPGPLALALLLCLALLGCRSTGSGPSQGFATERYVVRPLRAADAELDHEAVMASREHLRELFGGDWPPDDFTLEENRADLVRHEADFAAGRSFTYTLMTPEEDRVLGCLYLIPDSEEPERAVTLLVWTRPDFERGRLAERVAEWLRTEWPFEVLSVR